MLFLAEVSRYFTFHIFSRASPVLVDTCLLPDSSSHLLPTSSTGQPSKLPFTSLDPSTM